jgi:hydroxymethylpyrimidine pyrophosphatase-like HAD family hydrolase
MGNALPEVRHAVRYVTASNERDGVALAIEKFALSGVRADKKSA